MVNCPPLIMVALFFAQAADIVGTARIIDADTIVVAGTKVRLEGIDAPERGQMCTANGVPWACGDTATAWLRELLAGREVACVPKGNDRYGRVLATCFLGGENLNDRIVREGWALTATRLPTWMRRRRPGGGRWAYGVRTSNHLGSGGRGIAEGLERRDIPFTSH